MTPGKSIALTIWTSVGKVMSLFFNMLSRLVIVFFFFSSPKEQDSFNFMAVELKSLLMKVKEESEKVG